MRKILLTFFVLLTTTIVFAQSQNKKHKPIVPGYRGLKCTIKYDFGINGSWYDIQTSKMPVMIHNAEVGYVVARTGEVVVRYSYNSYNSPAPSGFAFKDSRPELSEGSEQVWYQPYGNYTSRTHYVGVVYKWYFGGLGYIAPVGRYLGIGLTYGYNVANASFQTGEWNSGGWGSIMLPPLALRKRVTSHDLYATVEFGRNFILANRLVMDITATINVPLSGFGRMMVPNLAYGKNYSESDWSKNFVQELNYDNMLKNLFQLKVGFGVLAF